MDLYQTATYPPEDSLIAPPESRSNRLREEVGRSFLELRDPVVRYLRTFGCRHWLAEEIAHEAFLRLHASLQSGLQVNDVRAWVFRVARNLWVDSRREHQRHGAYGDERGRSHRTRRDAAPNPEQQAIEGERIRLIEEEVSRLPELTRECLKLRARGLRYREIAVALDISMTGAVDHVRRGVKKLGKLFNS